ncbi:MAG TPA: DUF6522 family protein [Lysobacter sp.]
MDADRPGFEIEGERVAGELGLETAEFRTLMEQGRIAVLCERGTGEDEGVLRASFYHGKRRARFLIDRAGNIQPG